MANELLGIEYLRNKLSQKRTRVLLRYQYYDMKNVVMDFGISTPPQLRWFMTSLGWCAKAVDSLADRLNVQRIKDDDFDMNQIFLMNNQDVLYDTAIRSALIGSCSFVYIAPDEDGYPKMQSIDGSNATGILDPITGLLKEGYAVLQRDESDNVLIEAYFEPNKTTYYYADGTTQTFKHSVKYPLLVPIIYKPDSKPDKWFGHSRISRACMDLQNSAMRTVKRSEIAAEFYAFPQKYVTGLSDDAEAMDKWRATMSSLLQFTKDEDGDHPIVGQFTQQSMEPHLEQLKMFASLFGAETGLTLDDLGFASGNPSSSDAIKAAHENLRLAARKAQGNFSSGLLNAGMVAACLRDDTTYKRKAFYDTKIIWTPVFEPDGSSLSGIGDAMIKIKQSFPDYVTEEKFNQITGI